MDRTGIWIGMTVVVLLLGGCGQKNANEIPQATEQEVQSVMEYRATEELQREAPIEDTETDAIRATGTEEVTGTAMEGNLTVDTTEEKTWEELPAIMPSIASEAVTDVSIVIVKSQHTLTLYNEGEEIGVYSVGVAKNPLESKEQEGDNKTPEGEYYVCNKNENSKYHLALGLSYPNIADANRGFEDGLITETQRDSIISAIERGGKPDWYTPLGGEIMIHGQKGDLGGQSDWTRGCCAVDNEVMDILWKYVKVGTKVTIQK